MLIEELIRLGRPVLESGLEPRQVLRLITDAADERVKNFYRHVIVVELPPSGAAGAPAVLPVQNWQVEPPVAGKKKPEVEVEVERMLGVPVSLPTGGNPLHPQGRYGLPVYPLYDPHMQAFRASRQKVRAFLAGRLERTPGFAVEEALLEALAAQLHAAIAAQCPGPEKRLGILVLARCEPGGFFTYGERASRTRIGRSALVQGKVIEPNEARIAEALWAARVEEGAALGRRQGPCSISGAGESSIAAYCKAWPWALPTWTCPVAHGGNTALLVEGLALSEASYRALTLGANLFQRLTRPLLPLILPELFAPVENCARPNAARNRSRWTALFGAALVLPLTEATLADPAERNAFAQGVLAMLETSTASEPRADRSLTAVTGFDVWLPEALTSDPFRLHLIYFSGEVSRGDIHLRASIPGVLPRTVAALQEMVRPCREQLAEFVRGLFPNASASERDSLDRCYQSLPYLLARGYGGAHLWPTLEQCLQRRPLHEGRVVAHTAARLRSLGPRWPDSRFKVREEVLFLLVCRDLIRRYNREVAVPPQEDPMPMRPWRELLAMIEERPPGEMHFPTGGVAELGFACGALLHRFSVWYWHATRDGREGKDYLKHRVLIFGTDLSPEVVWRVGLGKLCDVAARHESTNRRLGRTFRQRLGVLLTELEQRAEQVRSHRDEFMTGFWAGYCLQGYDRPRPPNEAAAASKGEEP